MIITISELRKVIEKVITESNEEFKNTSLDNTEKPEKLSNRTMSDLENYNEAKDICEKYKNFKGDKRSLAYRRLEHLVIDVYMGRMNNFAKKLNLPSYVEYFYGKNPPL